MKLLIALLLFLLFAKGEEISETPSNPFSFWPLVTPLLGLEFGLSEGCFNASLAYVEGIQNNESWALRMLDASGSLPFLQEGFLSYILELPVGEQLCSLLDPTLNGLPYPDEIQNFYLNVSFSSNYGLGSPDECLSVKEIPTQYCKNDLVMVGSVGNSHLAQKDLFDPIFSEVGHPEAFPISKKVFKK